MLKIIQITPSYKPAYVYGGPIMSVAKLCEELVTNGIDVEVLTTTANGKTELQTPLHKPQLVDGVKVTYFKRLTKDHTHFSPDLLRTLRKKIIQEKNKAKNEEPTKLVIHIHSWWNLVAILSLLVAKFYQIPVLLSPRGMLSDYSQQNRHISFKKIIHNILGYRLLQYCQIHATSFQEEQEITKTIQCKSIVVIPNIVALPNTFQFRQPIKNSSFNLVFLSRVEQKKGLDILFEALAELEIDFSLTIAGTGNPDYIKQLKLKAKQLNLSEKICWKGFVSNDDKFELLKTQDLLVLTSQNENFANVVIESLSVGTPVLISKSVGLANYVQQKNLGWVTELHLESIKEAILNAYQNPTKIKKINETSAAIVNADFSSRTLLNQYYAIYKKLSNEQL